MRETGGSARKPTVLHYVVCYLLFILLIVIGTVSVLEIWRVAILEFLSTFMRGNFATPAILEFTIVLMMLGLFLLVLIAEPYLRQGVQRGLLLRRWLRLAVPLAAFGIIGLLLRALILMLGGGD